MKQLLIGPIGVHHVDFTICVTISRTVFEYDSGTVGRPTGVVTSCLVCGQPMRIAAVAVHHKYLRKITSSRTAEGDLCAVRRPGRKEITVEAAGNGVLIGAIGIHYVDMMDVGIRA